MPRDIQFPEAEPRYIIEGDCLAFLARVDGRPVECLVTMELLIARFGAQGPSEPEMRSAYQEHLTAIQAIARNHIEYGWIDEESRIFLTTRFTRITVTFGERFRDKPSLRTSAEIAHRILAEIIGPNSEEIIVEWDVWGSDSPPKRGASASGYWTLPFLVLV